MRLSVWLIVAVYVLMTCGSLLAAECCQNDAAHCKSEHDAHRHVHYQFQIAAHALSHFVPVGRDSFFVSRHCCCVSQGEQESDLQPHAITRQASTLRDSDSSSKTILVNGPFPDAGSARGGMPYLLDNLQGMFILQSIHSTVLLI